MFGHPKGLQTLFFTEMWERLSYYGMRGLLILFMVDSIENGGYNMDAATAGAIYALYTAFVYLTGLPGGWVADRIIGMKKAVYYGGIVIAAGHFSMAIPSEITFFGGLLLITIGTGLLKPNVSAVLGDLYPEGGARRDAGFSIFYMGINIGAFLGPIVCSYLGEEINWHLGFSAAGVGMVFGVIQYKLGLGNLEGCGEINVTQEQKSAAIKQVGLGAGAFVALIVVLIGLNMSNVVDLSITTIAGATGVIIVGIAIVYFSYMIFFQNWTCLLYTSDAADDP